MVQLDLWSGVVSLVIAGGITFLFRSRTTTPQHTRALFIMGLVSASGIVITVWSPPFVSGMIHTSLVILAMPMPAIISILAGIEFRRAYHTRPPLFFAISGLMLSSLILHTAPSSQAEWLLWSGLIYKIFLCGFLLHGVFSFWSGRRDDMDVQRLSRRHVLEIIFLIALFAALLIKPGSDEINITLIALWFATTCAVRTTDKKKIKPVFENYEEKLAELRALFDRRRIYREDDLTLERIGDRLLLKNQAVRILIHDGLGFPRLSDLLDHYRIRDARIILEDPDQVEMKLVEVAISVGYRSLTSFEAAFRHLVGKTAREYRQHYLDQANANRPLQLTNSDR